MINYYIEYENQIFNVHNYDFFGSSQWPNIDKRFGSQSLIAIVKT